MNFPYVAARNLTRNKTRVILTVIGVGVTVLAFVLIRTVLWAYSYGAEHAAKDRLGTRHKVSFIMQMPKHYVDKIATVPGVAAVTWFNWFGGVDPKDTSNFYAKMAVDHTTLFKVYRELIVDDASQQRWNADPKSVIIGRALAKRLNVKIGDKVHVLGDIYPGDWTFTVAGIYALREKTFDEASMFLRWDMLNNALPEQRRDQVGWIVTLLTDLKGGDRVAGAIDRMFDEFDIQTITQSEKELNNAFMGMFEAILKALGWISVVILFIMGLILGNTIAMGVRERTTEYGVLRALGFVPKHIVGFVLGEGMVIGLMGAAVGLLMAYPLVGMFAAFIADSSLASWFPYIAIPPTGAALAVAFAVGLGAVASVIPAWGASRVSVTDAIRKVG